MSASRSNMRPPRKILLATDLGSHCDRALDRAAQLARQWQATLHVVHALQPQAMDSWMQPAGDVPQLSDSDIAEAVERQVRCDLREEVAELVVHVAAGEPAQVIADTATNNQCELIVLGAEGATLAGSTLGSTAAPLLRKSPISVLIVKARPHDAYRQILVGTDFTVESRHGLATAAAWFPDAGFDLMHALDIPYKSLFLEAGRSDEFAKMERDTIKSFVASAQIPECVRQGLRTHVEHGHPEIMLRKHVIANATDLTVVGALSRGLAFHVMVGGNAARIVQTVPGDILLVRGAAAGLLPAA